MQIIRFFLEYPWRCQNVISFFIFFLVFLYIHIFSFLSSFNSLQLIHTSTAGLCMVQFYLLPSPPGNPRDKSSPSGPGVGGGPVRGQGAGANQKYLLFDFAKYVHVISRAVYTIATRWLFLRKSAGIFWRVVGEEQPIKTKVCIYNGMF